MIKSLFVLICVLVVVSCADNSASKTQSSQGDVIVDKTHGDGGSAWGNENCDSCHAIKTLHKGALKSVRNLSQQKGYAVCVSCHGANGTEAKRQCVVCHNDRDLSHLPYTDGDNSHHFKDEESSLLNDDECIVCHESSDMNGRFDVQTDLTAFKNSEGNRFIYDNEAQFCQSCHNRTHQHKDFPLEDKAYDDPLISIESDYKHFDYHGFRDGSDQGTYAGLREGYQYPQLVNCSDCHALHGTDNNHLIIDSSKKGVKRLDHNLRMKPYRIDTDGHNGTVAGDYGQLCVLCHNMQVINDSGALNAGNDLSGVHEVNTDCRDCHTHGEATQVGL